MRPDHRVPAWGCATGRNRSTAWLVGLGCTAAALAQSDRRAAFVCNNGNLEGSVTSFVFDAGGAPEFVHRVITGTRQNTSQFGPGCNAYTISLTPQGRYLATGHATGEWPTEQITIFEVAPDATFAILGAYTTPDGPLDIEWINDELLAVLHTSLSGTNHVYVYRFDPAGPSLTLVGQANAGTFTGSIAVHPNRQFLYAGDSFQNVIYVYSVAPDGALTQVQAQPTAYYPLGVTIAPDGRYLYAGGGISGTGRYVLGFSVGPDGLLTTIPGSPFTSPGQSPKDCAFSDDARLLFVSHGTDATIRSFSIDPGTGALTSTGGSFDVGLQGSLGDHAVLGALMLTTDNTTATDGIEGLYSLDILADGFFSANGPAVPSQGIGEREIAVWSPRPCRYDLDASGSVDLSDLSALLAAFGLCTGDPGYELSVDLNRDGCVDLADLSELLSVFGLVCE